MYDVAIESGLSPIDISKFIKKDGKGKTKIRTIDKSNFIIKLLVLTLTVLTIYSFLTFDYKNINLLEAIKGTLVNIETVFLNPKLKHSTISSSLYQLLVTFCLGVLATITGAFIALFASFFCAKNIANPFIANIIKTFVAFIRAVPTILWVLIFAISAGLGSVAAVVGLTFHSAGYLTKAYSESIEEIDNGTIEALRASGANFWQIIFQGILPSSISSMIAWTFMRFEINFTNAIAMGAAAGAGGIGFDLFMSGSFYFDLREVGYFTYIIIIAVVLLEMLSTKLKAKLK